MTAPKKSGTAPKRSRSRAKPATPKPATPQKPELLRKVELSEPLCLRMQLALERHDRRISELNVAKERVQACTQQVQETQAAVNTAARNLATSVVTEDEVLKNFDLDACVGEVYSRA